VLLRSSGTANDLARVPAVRGARFGSTIAAGTGTGVVIEASDLTLVRGDILAAVDAIRLSRRTLRTIKSNLFWAFAYNVAALLQSRRCGRRRRGAVPRRSVARPR